MIELARVAKTFNEGKSNVFSALKGIDLNIESRLITVFRGPSGSGKTTLLSIIGGMARPTSGRIWLNGREMTSLPERFAAITRRETFGFIFQNYNLIKGITVLENVMLPAYPTGMRHHHIRERAMSLLDRFRLGSKAFEKMEHLSGGEQQRTAIARALINDPPVIIADEPTAHLDTELSLEFMNIVSELKQGAKTLLMASHDPLVCDFPSVDRLVSLRDGMIINEEGAS